MNWQAVNFDWNQVRAFLATVDEGSLSAAARALGLTQPTLGRQVTALEEQLGVTLFERSGRSLILTPTGLSLIDHVRAMGEAASRLSLAASGQSTSVEGEVKITASEMYSACILPEFVEALRVSHPGIVIEIVATNSLSDLRHREADIAMRNTEPTDPDLIGRRIREDMGGMYATSDLIERYGPFVEIGDLAEAPFVRFGSQGSILDALRGRDVPVTERNFVAGSDNHLVHWELARRGIGIGLNAWVVGDRTPGMERVLDDKISFAFPVWLVAPQELRTNRRIRIVFDLLADFLSNRRQEKASVKSA